MAKREPSRDVADVLNEKFGVGAVVRLDDAFVQDVAVVSTGSIGLDRALGVGGLPRGRLVEVYGPESCLDADTFIQYEVRTPGGARQNNKGGTIERLWHRFHGEPMPGKGGYRRPQTRDSEFWVSSINEEGRVFKNRVLDVVRTGERECLEVVTAEGRIVATGEHKFWTGTKYVPASDLEPGSIVYAHNGTHYCKADRERMWEGGPDQRAYLYVGHHPVAGVKVVRDRSRGYENAYRRLLRSRAVVEAKLNGLDLSAYVERLHTGDLDGLRFLSRDDHVHHRDEDVTNDADENLVVISAAEHGRLHALKRHNDLRFAAVPVEVQEVAEVGVRRTYDIRVESPFNNYVAAGFVVHNSGKTTLCLHAVANAQAAGDICMFVDAEHALDVNYARALGVRLSDLLVSQPDYGEQALEIVDVAARTGSVKVIVVDSVAALTPKAELDGDMGDTHVGLQARLMSQAMRKLASVVATTDALVIFINQLRHKIGVRFGSPETTTGGNALKYYASVRLDIRRIGQVKQGEAKVGNRTRVKVAKNKVAAPFKEAEFDIDYGTGISKVGELIELGVELGIVGKAGAWLSYKGERIGQGLSNAKAFLLENRDVADAIEEEVRAR